MAAKPKFIIKKSFITEFMKFKKWTISDLEDKIGYKKQQVSQTISGKIEPTMNFLHRLCALTGCKAEELIETVWNKG